MNTDLNSVFSMFLGIKKNVINNLENNLPYDVCQMFMPKHDLAIQMQLVYIHQTIHVTRLH